MKQRARNHQNLVDRLYDSLTHRGYKSLLKNVDYAFGECDVLAATGKRSVYYEVKGKHTESNYWKAVEQLQRWSIYRSRDNPAV
ncbi:hypothetical protein LCGC14_3154170, partial [marine sediment metagenome]